MTISSRAATAVVLLSLVVGQGWAAAPGGEGAPAALAADALSPVDLLRAMVEREPTLRYQAVRASLGGRQPGGRRERVYRDGADRARVEVLGEDGQPVRTVVRVGDRAAFWSAREPSSWRQGALPGEHWGAWQHLDLVLANYQVERVGQEEFLGRPVVVLQLTGKHADRPRVRLWIDRESCLNVKLEKASPSGKRVLGFEFLELSFPERFDESLFTLPQAGQGPVSPGAGAEKGEEQRPAQPEQARQPWVKRFNDLESLAGGTEAPVVVPGVVPEGFRATDFSLLSRMGVLRVGYSDGLSEISLYQSSGREARGREGDEERPRAPGRRPEGPEAGRERDPGSSPRAETGREGREGGEHPREGGGWQQRVWPTEFTEVTWQGVTLRVGQASGMVVVRRNLTVGTPAVEVQATVVGEIGEDELKVMSASLSGYQRPVPAEGNRGGAPGGSPEPK
jgi:negative regulator of sigma E activity